MRVGPRPQRLTGNTSLHHLRQRDRVCGRTSKASINHRLRFRRQTVLQRSDQNRHRTQVHLATEKTDRRRRAAASTRRYYNAYEKVQCLCYPSSMHPDAPAAVITHRADALDALSKNPNLVVFAQTAEKVQ